MGAQTERVGRPSLKTGPRGASVAYRSSSTAGELNAGGGEDGPVRGAGARDELAAQGLADAVPVAGVDAERLVRRKVRELLLLGGGERGPGETQPLGAGLVEDAVVRGDAPVAGGEELGGGGGRGGVPGEGVAVDPDGFGLGEVEGGGGSGGLGQEVLLLAAQHPHLVAGGLEVQGLVGGEVLLVALVEDVAQAGGPGGERDLVYGAVGVGAGGEERLRPVGGGRGAGPHVQAPAVVRAVGALVVQDGLGLVLGRVGGAVGAGGLLALLQPDLAALRHVEGAVGGDVLGAVLVDDEVADGGGAGLEADVGEGAVRVAAGEGVPLGPGRGLTVGEVAPGVEAPVRVVAVGAVVVDDRVVALGGGGGLLRRGLARGGRGEGARGVSGGVDGDGLVAQGVPAGAVTYWVTLYGAWSAEPSTCQGPFPAWAAKTTRFSEPPATSAVSSTVPVAPGAGARRVRAGPAAGGARGAAARRTTEPRAGTVTLSLPAAEARGSPVPP